MQEGGSEVLPISRDADLAQRADLQPEAGHGSPLARRQRSVVAPRWLGPPQRLQVALPFQTPLHRWHGELWQQRPTELRRQRRVTALPQLVGSSATVARPARPSNGSPARVSAHWSSSAWRCVAPCASTSTALTWSGTPSSMAPPTSRRTSWNQRSMKSMENAPRPAGARNRWRRSPRAVATSRAGTLFKSRLGSKSMAITTRAKAESKSPRSSGI